MNWTWYLFRFDGRIGRAEFWYSLIFVLSGMILLLLLCLSVMSALGSEVKSFNLNAEDVFKIVDPAAYRWSLLDNLPLLLLKLAATGLMLWIDLAIMVKRLHDRNKSAWWLLAYFVLPGLYKQFEDRLPDSYWMLPLALASVILPLAAFIETGFLRGTVGPNRFGPDPAAEGDSTSAAPSAKRWDQSREIEFVPPSASPPGGMHVKRGA
ncbi:MULTISPECIES: DUF805 domain-containing protein [Bradyrhizobium]|uniref:DUF805 domain-containing protein n=2 Tax=Nitrobacteraceae TaxID=41294 RepID=UPI00155DDFE4|nr:MULTISPECIES: DUF805 domain-containing protein [Bradyrhizobium]MDD1519903.1 DUF805 domain-containing protein [Bradyrhizobium sp. WBAH30]MDD1544147.1 DUF805 domain-containing protein [Bradyrhizobium sp. WBAH41]MDD1566627.1 DUF805 domain-containing protein [Bradyrhizobium sp. WBAH33]NRB89105.1 DUF805 domain-containing protein [Bradyrhizobium sp. WBAH10]QCJ72528.1 DUF805 domain-containing protein [Bradyrhizobium sp. WBAH10]